MRRPPRFATDVNRRESPIDAVHSIEDRGLDDSRQAKSRSPGSRGQRTLEDGIPIEYLVGADERGKEDSKSKNDGKGYLLAKDTSHD